MTRIYGAFVCPPGAVEAEDEYEEVSALEAHGPWREELSSVN